MFVKKCFLNLKKMAKTNFWPYLNSESLYLADISQICLFWVKKMYKLAIFLLIGKIMLKNVLRTWRHAKFGGVLIECVYLYFLVPGYLMKALDHKCHTFIRKWQFYGIFSTSTFWEPKVTFRTMLFLSSMFYAPNIISSMRGINVSQNTKLSQKS